MNMPPPHGPGAGHPGHPGMGATSPSPGMMNRPHPQQFIPHPQQQHYIDSPSAASNRGRKRKLTAQHPHTQHPHQHQQHLARRPSMHGPPHGHPSQPHGGPHGFPGRPMPPFLGLNLPPTIADELPDSIFDDLDRLTPRDIAVARYAKNHEHLSMVFDARRIDTLTPAPSPYADVKVDDLKAKIEGIQREVEVMEKEHAAKLRDLREQSVKKAKKGDSADGTVPVWGENASRGRILGVGYVRAETPEELRPPKPGASGVDEQMQAASNEEVSEEEKAKEAERRQAEKEAIEKINIDLGVTQVQSQVAPPAPTPAPVPAPAPAATSTPAPAAETTEAATTTEQATTEIKPPVSAAEEPPAAPVLAHAEAPAEAAPVAPVAASEAAPATAEASAGEGTAEVSATGDTAEAVQAVASQPGTLADVAMLDQLPAAVEEEGEGQAGADAAEAAPEAVASETVAEEAS